MQYLRQREIVHFQRFGEALRGVQDKMAEKKFYMNGMKYKKSECCNRADDDSCQDLNENS